MMGFAEVTGDLFDMGFPAIGHGCNCLGVMGAGIATEFRKRWPEMYDQYREFCEEGFAMPGDYYPFTDSASGLHIFNLLTQPLPGPTAKLEYIEAAVTGALQNCADIDVDVLGIPRIGAGLGGLKWNEVHAVLREASKKVPAVNLVAVTLPPVPSKPHQDTAHLSAFPHAYLKVNTWASRSGGGMEATDYREVSDPLEADLITSAILGSADRMHTVMLDIDVPAVLVPSSTPGHTHLYVDVMLTWERYVLLMKAMAAAGIVEHGYVAACQSSGFTSLRLPWVKK